MKLGLRAWLAARLEHYERGRLAIDGLLSRLGV